MQPTEIMGFIPINSGNYVCLVVQYCGMLLHQDKFEEI